MSSSEYNQLLKFLYFEGYADSYEEAENLLEEMSDEEFEDLLERKYDFDEPLPGSGETPLGKMKDRIAKHQKDYLKRPNSAVGQRSKSNAKKMKAIASTVEVGDDPRNTMHGQDLRKIREEVIEYLFVEGYADTIENAELIAESISEEWVNEIMEGYVDLNTKTGEMRRRANRTLFVKNDWERANKIDNTRETHSPEKVQAKAEANRRRGEGG
jgi:hypothetical protein